MSPLVLLFRDISGRLPRGRFWLGVLYLVVISIVLFVILTAFGLGHETHFTTIVTPDSGAPTTGQGTTFTLNPWGNFVATLITTYPWLVLGLKRRHDRGNRGVDLMVYQAVLLIFQLLTALNIGDIVSGLLGFLLLIGGIYLIVVMGFLKGTAGSNDYGPDPLGGSAAVAA